MESSLVGKKEEFAIEWVINDFDEKHCIGNLCFWVGGKELGEFENESWLDSSLFYLEDFFRHKHQRAYENSVTLSKEQLFFCLYGKFFSSEAKESGEYLNMGIMRSIFWLDDIGDASFRDSVSVILVDEPLQNQQRVIWKTTEEDTLYEWFLPLNTFEQVSKQFMSSVILVWRNRNR